MICEVCNEDKVCLTTCPECDLKVYENIRKQDALEELKRVYNKLTFRMLKSEDSIKYRDEIGDFIIKRIKELECEKE